MPIQKITIAQYFSIAGQCVLLDVRSPGEFAHAHIPDAINLPLFTDDERKVVGTAYKQQSREKAIKIGLNYFGPRMTEMVEATEKIITEKTATSIVLHCWRGGMRSAGVAWLLDLYGFTVYTITGGYKSYRKWVLEQFEQPYNFKVIGGNTGCGKTELINVLARKGFATIDLEAMAHHKGSVFGGLGESAQPSQEMFENKLAITLYQNKDVSIWLEDESLRIGNVHIPASLFRCKQEAPLYFLDIPFEERLKYITKGYGAFHKEKLVTAIMRIKKRLGPLETKTAINCLLEDDIKNSFAILLKYYDKHYKKGLTQRKNIDDILQKIPCQNVDANANAVHLLQFTDVF